MTRQRGVSLVLLLLLGCACALPERAEVPLLPDIWKVVEGSYHTDVMVTVPTLTPGVSITVEEMYDIGTLQGYVRTLDHGRNIVANYYEKSEQMFVIDDNICETGGIYNHPGYPLYGWNYLAMPTNGTQNYVYGPSALLRIPRDYSIQAEYKGETEIRDIVADHWTIQTRDNYTIDFFFASENWLMPYGHSLAGLELKAPLQVKVHGMQKDPWNINLPDKEMEVYYDFIYFQPFLEKKKFKFFLVPDGIACENRDTLNPEFIDPPEAPNMFSVFVETVFHNPVGQEGETIEMVVRNRLFYDKWRKLVCLHVNPDGETAYQGKVHKTVHDYNTGIAYTIDAITGKCDMTNILADEFGNQIGAAVIGNVIMANPDELFHLDGSYIYSGSYEERSILIDRWTSIRHDIMNSETGKPYKKVVVDYKFISGDVIDIHQLIERPRPASVHITIYEDNHPTTIRDQFSINFIGMSTSFELEDTNPFDVRECMPLPSMRDWYKITYEGDWYHGMHKNEDEFKSGLISRIVQGTHASYVRFPEIQLDHDQSLVYVLMLVLQHAPYRLQFDQIEDRKPTSYDTQLSLLTHDTEVCAEQCLYYTKFVCNSFYTCEALAKSCYVSNYDNSEGKPVGNKMCKHYKRTIEDDITLQLPNLDIEAWVADEIANKRFNYSAAYEDLNGDKQVETYSAVSIRKELLVDDPIFVDLIRDDFQPSFTAGRLKDKYTKLKTLKESYMTCLLNCEKQKGFRCETFSFCYNTGNCYMSDKVTSSRPATNDIVMQQDCVIVYRRHTDDYTPVDGLVLVEDPQQVVNKVLTADYCAYLCDTAKDFTCRSFEYCTSQLCLLHDSHYLDYSGDSSQVNDSALDCVHFSRDYSVDFEEHEHSVLSGTRDRFLTGASVEQCAKVCVEEPEFGCNGFDYCKSIESSKEVKCYLTEAHYSDNGFQLDDSTVCDHYSREYYDGQDRGAFSNTKNINDKYGPGDMAGLGCSMLIIGVALTLGAIFVYNKYYRP